MTVRFGILGCARIAPLALIRPARKADGAEVVAVGSRSRERAERYAKRHRIPRAYGSYDEVLADPNVNAVYVPLPNSLHQQWTIRALDAGKHVLCEKPLAGSEAEAKRMADAARGSNLVAMEAFHYRYHPLAQRIGTIVSSGELGELRQVEAELLVPVPTPNDIRWDPALAGGAAMDVGGYVVNMARFVAGDEPEVMTASGSLTRRGVDRNFEARLAFPRGVEAVVRGSLLSFPVARLRVRGTRGSLRVFNPLMPQLVYRLRVTVDGAERRERVADGTTYGHQLRAFVSAVEHGTPVATDFEDAVKNMRVLDRIRSLIGVRS
jgi:predicted dehydrogenase